MLYTDLSRIFEKHGRTDIGLKSYLIFLKIRVILSILSSFGKKSSLKHRFKIQRSICLSPSKTF